MSLVPFFISLYIPKQRKICCLFVLDMLSN